LFGADHLTFLIGLLLLRATATRIVRLTAALAAGNLAALLATTLHVFQPPARMIEPAIALTIVDLGIDNLMVRGGRDMRGWIACAFGLIHGFWFANGLLAADLPRRTLVWSLLSFDVGVEAADALALLCLGVALGYFHRRGRIGQRFVQAVSMLVIVSGTYYFVQRVFFPAGIY
jgi:hydrogenase/urease accessory protein HupE